MPPKTRGPRADRLAGDFDTIDASMSGDATEAGAAGAAGSETAEAAAARRTRAQNRAAKRAARGVRPKSVRGGPVRSKRGSNTPLIALAVAAVAVGAAVILLGNPFGSPGPSGSPGASGSPGVSPGPSSQVGDGTCPTSQPAPLAGNESKLVTIKTEKGDIVIKVDGVLSPIAAGNFVALAGCKFYDGVVFHRTPTLASGAPFVIQGGDPLGTGSGGPGYTIADEPVATAYKRGTVAMARTPEPHSQGSQFFIVLSDESGPILQSANTYAIFGNVVGGMEVADAIYQASGGAELPPNPIAMTSVTVSDVQATASPSAAP